MIDYEQALLGAVLGGYADVHGLSLIVAPSDFAAPAHETIWRSILRVHVAGHQPTALRLYDDLGPDVEKFPGGSGYLSELQPPIEAAAEWYAEKVRAAAVLRQIDQLGIRCRQLAAQNADDEIDVLLDRIHEWSSKVQTRSTGRFTSPAQALELVIDQAQRGMAAAMPHPWRDLDELLAGWYPGQFAVVAARPGRGKSIVVENAATYVAKTGRWVGYVSIEMTADELMQRTLANQAGVRLDRLRRGNMSDQDWSSVQRVAGVLQQLPMGYYDAPTQTIADIRAAAWESAQEARRNHIELGLIVVDYLQLATPTDRKIPRHLQVDEVSRGLKKLAKELRVPVLAAAQLNRQSEARGRPMLSDLRESGSVEQDADVVILLHEQEVEEGGKTILTGDVDVIVAKNRHGQLGVRSLHRYGEYGRIA